MSNITATPKSRNEIMNYASIIRKISGISSGYFDVVKFIEFDAYNIFGIDYEIVSDTDRRLESNEFAKFVPSENKIYLRESVYNRATDNIGQDRFTLAHELGHALFHKKQALSRSVCKPPTYMDPEWQANEFASHVLCPLSEIVDLGTYDIMETYGVSKQVANIQLKKLEVILC